MARQDTATATPRLRFPEFRSAQAWSVWKLGDACDLYQPETISSNSFVSNGRHLVYGAGGVIGRVDRFNHEQPEVIIGCRGVCGNASLTEPKSWITGNAMVISPKGEELSKTFLYYELCASDLSPVVSGSAQPQITRQGLRGFSLSVPIGPAEQEKVADCLTSLDEVVAAQGRKVEALKAHKRGLMQQLFPREGETRPRLRFPEFRDAPKWKSKALRDVASISSGTTPLRANPEFYDGGTIPWIKTTDLNNSLIYSTQECITSKAKATINPVGSVVVAMYGGFNQIGRTGLLQVPAATNQALSVLRSQPDMVLPVYLLAWLNAKVEVWKRIASSSRKDPNITSADVARFPISLPGIAEQRRIADFLSSLDTQITAESNQLAALKLHKQGLMQQLFPAPDAAAA